jgi:hypothetical protein
MHYAVAFFGKIKICIYMVLSLRIDLGGHRNLEPCHNLAIFSNLCDMNSPIYCNEIRPAAKIMPINSNIEILRAVPRMHAQLRRSKAAVRLQ